MCDICNGKNAIVDIEKIHEGIKKVLYVDKKYVLLHESNKEKDFMITFKICFCPMCGRKLGEE